MTQENPNTVPTEVPFRVETHDVYIYSGEIKTLGYEMLSREAKGPRKKYALLVLFTPGGDAHAGFRIARALQCYYDHFDILIPRICKSAGSLIAIGARSVFMDDMSELGPLDVQLKKKDEIFGHSSGLDIAHAINNVQSQAMTAFRNSLVELVGSAGISTKMAADIASNLTAGLFAPITAQVDPMKLSETQRALEIALAYGTRLNEKPQNLKSGALDELVTGYPSHGFVIDRKEAKKLFYRVDSPKGIMQEYSTAILAAFEKNTNNSLPTIVRLPNRPSGENNDQTPSDSSSTQSGDGLTSSTESRASKQASSELYAQIESAAKPVRKKRSRKSDRSI